MAYLSMPRKLLIRKGLAVGIPRGYNAGLTGQPRTIGDNLKRLRDERRLNQAELAAKYGGAQGSISKFETGAKRPGSKTLLRLAVALPCFVEEFFEGVDPAYDAVRSDLLRQKAEVQEGVPGGQINAIDSAARAREEHQRLRLDMLRLAHEYFAVLIGHGLASPAVQAAIVEWLDTLDADTHRNHNSGQ